MASGANAIPASSGATRTCLCFDQCRRSGDSHTSMYRLASLCAQSQPRHPCSGAPTLRSVAMRKSLSPSGDLTSDGSLRPCVPSLDVSTGAPLLTATHRVGSLPTLTAAYICWPAGIEPAKLTIPYREKAARRSPCTALASRGVLCWQAVMHHSTAAAFRIALLMGANMARKLESEYGCA